MNNEIKVLNRFTTLPILLDLLYRRKLVLLNPDLWDDRNDSKIISKYEERKGVNLFAICFSATSETVHHWKTFSHGASGCCIEFRPKMLLEIIEKIEGIRHRKVDYKRIKEVGSSQVELDMIPFTKRLPYECEKEYRIIFETTEDIISYEVDIPLDAIRKIKFSQQMPLQIFKTVKEHLKTVFPNLKAGIYHSTLYENHKWISSFEE